MVSLLLLSFNAPGSREAENPKNDCYGRDSTDLDNDVGTRVNMGLRDAIEISPDALSVLSKMGRLKRLRCINETQWLAQSHGMTSEEKLMSVIQKKIGERWKDVKIRVEGFDPDRWPETSVSNV